MTANADSRSISADDPYGDYVTLRRTSPTGYAYELEVSMRCEYTPGCREYDDSPGEDEEFAEHDAWFERGRGYWVRLTLTREDERQLERSARGDYEGRWDAYYESMRCEYTPRCREYDNE